jgi:hypothetical protein
MTAAQPGELMVVARKLLTTALGDDLVALYASNSGRRTDRLWLSVRPETSPQRVRQAVYPFWKRYRSLLAGGPLLAAPADDRRYARILPQEVAAFRVGARLLHGEDLLVQALQAAGADPLRSLAWIAQETLIGSAVVASPDEDWRQATGSTLRLSERLSRAAGRAGIAGRPSPYEVLARLHAFLAAASERQPGYRWEGQAPGGRPPAHLPGLLALLGWGERLIVVLPRVDQATLAAIDWHRVAELVMGEFETLLVATPWQMRVVASVAEAVSFTFRSFERVWGADILAGCRTSDEDVRLSAAVLPVRTLVERLPADYLTVEESELGGLIHAVQNVLQNIQMRNELWARIRGVAPRRPPEPLPGRETPPHQRIDALFRHLRWWTDRWAGPAVD